MIIAARQMRNTKTPKGKLLFTHVETSPEQASETAAHYRDDGRRVSDGWTVRTHTRVVRVDGVKLTIWIVVVRGAVVVV